MFDGSIIIIVQSNLLHLLCNDATQPGIHLQLSDFSYIHTIIFSSELFRRTHREVDRLNGIAIELRLHRLVP